MIFLIYNRSQVRCVVAASPPANIDWLKESAIISSGRFLFQVVVLVVTVVVLVLVVLLLLLVVILLLVHID